MRILYRCRKINFANVKYGILYNWYVATDSRNIAPAGWHVPTYQEMITLRNYLDPINITEPALYTNNAGGFMKETGTTYWKTPNTDATNTTGFNGRGSGFRANTGVFQLFNENTGFWNTKEIFNQGGCGFLNYYNSAFYTNSNIYALKLTGQAIRLLKDDSIDTGTMVDNDGYVYLTVKIGSQVWMAANLKTTKYRNGDIIPEVTDQTAWAALTTGALCAYDNDWSNV